MTMDNSNKHFDFSDSSSMKWRVLFSHLLGLWVCTMWNGVSVSNLSLREMIQHAVSGFIVLFIHCSLYGSLCNSHCALTLLDILGEQIGTASISIVMVKRKKEISKKTHSFRLPNESCEQSKHGERQLLLPHLMQSQWLTDGRVCSCTHNILSRSP